MPSTTHPAAAEREVPGDASTGSSGAVARLVTLPLWVHGLVLALAVLAFVGLSRPGTGFTSDEGAALAQAQVLRDTGSWQYRYPLSWLEDARSASPFVRADVGSEGVAPYAKHPTYPLLLWSVGAGTAGALGLSIAGTVAAALMAALLARRLAADEAAPVTALWLTGLGTPLLFDAGLALAHTLAAALFGGATLLTLRALERGSRRWAWSAGAAGAALLASLVRTEATMVVVGLAVAVVLVVRSRWAGVVGAALVAAALVAHLVDKLAVQAIVGTPSPVPGNTVTSGLRGRWDGLYTTWLSSSASARRPTGTLLWLALAVIAVAVVLLRTGRIRPRSFGVVVGVAALPWLLRLLDDQTMRIPGLVLTVPVLWGMGWFVSGEGVRPSWPIPAVACVIGTVGILATQYSIGGGVEWGGRYFAVLLPVAVAVIVGGSLGTIRAALPDARARSMVLAVAVAVTLVVAGLALSTLRQGHDGAAQLARGIAAATVPTAGADRPVVMTSNRLLPQILYADLDRYDWVAADADALPGFARQLAQAGVDRLVLVTPGGDGVPAQLVAAGWAVRATDASNVYDIDVLERTEP